MSAKHLTNPLATVDQLYRRRTFSALPTDLQDAIFFSTQRLTQAAGLLLRLPQSVTAQASVVLARYWVGMEEEALLRDEFSDVSAASLFLVAKLSSHPCRPRDICNVYAYLLSPSCPLSRSKSKSSSSSAQPEDEPPPPPESYYLSESAYGAQVSRILSIEGQILYTLGFDTHVALPHGLAVTYLQALDFCSSNSRIENITRHRHKITSRVIAYLNTALLSPQMLYLTHQPNALAVAAIYSAVRDADDTNTHPNSNNNNNTHDTVEKKDIETTTTATRPPDCAWWEVFDVDREELGFLVVAMRSLEGIVRKLQRDVPDFCSPGHGVFARKHVEASLVRRGLSLKYRNGGAELDEEVEAMMRSMDQRAEAMEE
ncbi:cyclin-like protein [Xylariaceae sp. FL0594]|nr:cyclin-like protein [Xylariaceae sp. FL0594]